MIIISAILGILFFGAIWYNYHVDSCFNEARRLYLSEEYLDAYIKLMDYFILVKGKRGR